MAEYWDLLKSDDLGGTRIVPDTSHTYYTLIKHLFGLTLIK